MIQSKSSVRYELWTSARKGTCRQMVALRTLERAGRTYIRQIYGLCHCCYDLDDAVLQVVNPRSNVHLLINAARGAKSETDDRSFDEISYLPDVQIIPMLANIYINKSCKML